MTQPTNSANTSATQNITLLRKLLTDPATNPAEATQEWLNQAEQMGFKNQRMELKLLLGLLDRVAFPLPLTLQAYQIYYKGFLHELAEHYAKAAQLTTNDKALPLIEQALEILKTENSAKERIKELNGQLGMLRKQQSKGGKWFLGRH